MNRISPTDINDISLTCLYRDNDYLFVSKPADIRMDGDYDITLEKLLIKQFSGNKSNYKWIHQLDYATSGVICIGLNKKATAFTSLCFAERKTCKEYVAMVYGHVNISNITNEVAINELTNIRNALSVEDNKPKHKRKVDNDDKQWQDDLKEENLIKCLDVLNSLNIDNLSNNIELFEMKSNSLDSYLKNSKLRKKLRKYLKSLGLLPEISIIDNEKVLSEKKANQSTVIQYNKYNFDINECVVKNQIYKINNNGELHVVVMIPIVEFHDSFHCELESSKHKGKYAETEIIIEKFEYYQNQPVTFLRLIPRTGRRHQLRLHCLALGHPIVGDCTYAKESFNPKLSHRMMLHAYKLKIPKNYEIKNLQDNKEVEEFIEVQSENPFYEYLIS